MSTPKFKGGHAPPAQKPCMFSAFFTHLPCSCVCCFLQQPQLRVNLPCQAFPICFPTSPKYHKGRDNDIPQLQPIGQQHELCGFPPMPDLGRKLSRKGRPRRPCRKPAAPATHFLSFSNNPSPNCAHIAFGLQFQFVPTSHSHTLSQTPTFPLAMPFRGGFRLKLPHRFSFNASNGCQTCIFFMIIVGCECDEVQLVISFVPPMVFPR